ncbi:MAG TPA: molybdopterin-dependent oxidoreductase [Anaerolineaceae bacterium]|nr:molybdopterin-dependent oxidoreductase [Anaerolineaceae bacterium]
MKVTINDKMIEVPQGTTVLQASRLAGFDIPTLCDHPALIPYGGCRLCLVEVQGARTLQPSCTLPVNDGMVVKTESEKISAARKFVLTLLFSERNHFCPYCQVSGGDCELQNAALKEGMGNWPLPPNWQRYPVDASHEYFVIDHNRCILCRRCVRACGELVGNFTLGFEERGAKSFLVADFGVPIGQSTCISCGTCTQVCPTGAIIDRVSAYRGKVIEVEHHNSICLGCSVGCGIDVLTRDNTLVRIEGDWSAAVNGGVICKVGRFLPLDEDRQRVTTPLVRRSGALQPASWDEALYEIATALKPLVGNNGSGVAAMASTRLPAEALYAFKELFGREFHSHMVTSTEEGVTTGLAAALADELGKSFEGHLGAVQSADCILNIGVNLADNHEVVGFLVKRILPQGIKLITVDPNANPLDPQAELALHPQVGSDVEFIRGLSAAVLKAGLAKNPVEMDVDAVLVTAAMKTGLPVESIEAAAHLLALADRPAIIFGKGISAQTNNSTLKALVEFARLIGALDEKHSNLLSTKGQANSVTAAQYHLDQPLKINGHRAAFIAIGDEKPTKRLIQKLENVPFLVVQASYASQLTAMADVVLPVTIWAEQEGHYVNLEGRIQLAQQSITPEDMVWTNQAALEGVAARLGLRIDGNWKEELKKRVSMVEIS